MQLTHIRLRGGILRREGRAVSEVEKVDLITDSQPGDLSQITIRGVTIIVLSAALAFDERIAKTIFCGEKLAAQEPYMKHCSSFDIENI